MAALIDSSVFIAGERGRIDLADLLASLGGELLALSAVTASELLYGLQRARTAAQRERRNAYVEAIFAQMTVLAFDLTVARVHSAVSTELDRTGRQVGAHDLMIAATAMAHDYRVATRDLRSFPKIPGLETVSI
ncbi:PIN domain-containing protein [Candidatus Binatus sp.]|uniref:PIN domain-containing protein n=1 Tax=Candidatus Binatus sp. TaxID=2811406 RepID=UPI002FD9BF36